MKIDSYKNLIIWQNMIRQKAVALEKKISFKPLTSNLAPESAFTLIEMLVVMAIIAVVSASLILYSRTGERQIILLKDQARITAALFRAKALSIATFGESGVPCGYGVHFEAPRSFLIFKDLAPDCSVSDNIYSGGNEVFESFELNQSLNFGNLTLTDVIFIPPNPRVVITPAQDEAVIVIRTADGTSSLNVKVTSAGQISTSP